MTIIEDASECVQGGDSGGALYLQNGSTGSYAVGVLSGTNNQGALLTNCRNYYTPVKFVYYGGAIRTSPVS